MIHLLFALTVTLAACSASEVKDNLPATNNGAAAGRILVVYLSRTNNTKAIAEMIQHNIGNALFCNITFKQGVPNVNNFDSYRMIRINEAPKSIDVHFVQNDHDPTGMGEPAFPPVFAALANELYKLTGKCLYDQPFGRQLNTV